MTYDFGIVGAGILGLAHAWHLARAGKRVVVFERGHRAQGASVRNFGMLWPIGQPPGEPYETALRSRQFWLEALIEADIWHERCGSLHLTYAPDELAVLTELQGSGLYPASLLTPAQVARHAQGVRTEGLHGALWSETEICIDPREAVAKLAAHLETRYGVAFRFDTTVLGFKTPLVATSGEPEGAEQLIVCTGDDIQTLYPSALRDESVVRCKLQMMRTEAQPDSWRIGPMLAAGLTLAHYRAFEICPTLPALKERLEREYPEYKRYGIHVLVSQNGAGELTLGDSHEYGAEIEPFDKSHIDTLILKYLEGFLDAPHLRIASRWQGTYLKHRQKPWVVAHPDSRVTLVTGVGGAGMTLSFGLAEKVIQNVL
jgi:D-hydroxyproline dehydrogenase subunit beta